MLCPWATIFRTVILFWVSVPVLSEQITETEPNPSTACNFRIIACSFAIFCVPNESTMVTMELRASGMAATARAIANIRAFIMLSKFRTSTRNNSNRNTIALMTKIAIDSFWPNWSSVRCIGVLRSEAFCINAAIFPTSVSMPTFVTRQTPRP